MRVDVLTAPGIKSWATMPATESSRLDKISGAEANGVSDTTLSRTNNGNGCRAKDRRRFGVEKVYNCSWWLGEVDFWVLINIFDLIGHSD